MTTKKKIVPIAASLTEEQVETQLARYSDLVFTLSQIEADQKKDLTALDAELLPIRERYRAQMERRAETIHNLKLTLTEIHGILQNWAEAHREEFFTTKRSREMLHATVGFRAGNYRVDAAKGRTWDRALYWLGRVIWGRKYLRVEINREQLIEDRLELAAKPERLRKIGLVIVQDEKFFVKTKQVRSDALQPAAPREVAA